MAKNTVFIAGQPVQVETGCTVEEAMRQAGMPTESRDFLVQEADGSKTAVSGKHRVKPNEQFDNNPQVIHG